MIDLFGLVGKISIHAPRTGSDRVILLKMTFCLYFNPRSPHGERRRHRLELLRPHDDFNPRSPHGERRRVTIFPQSGQVFQSTLPARGATIGGRGSNRNASISIHAPRTGSDITDKETLLENAKFQSTLPARGATLRQYRAENRQRISIHAPRTGSDRPRDILELFFTHFNPRSPHGERLRNNLAYTLKFHFNPRSPHGERQHRGGRQARGMDFNPRSPHGERRKTRYATYTPPDFNPRSPHGERRRPVLRFHPPRHFNPRSPHGERLHNGGID